MLEILHQETINPDNKYYVKLAILDSGVDIAGHPFFNTRISVYKDFIEGETSPKDTCGHGTACLSLITGCLDCGITGIVTDNVQLLVGRILDNSGKGDPRILESALCWCLEQGVDIVSLSLGTQSSPSKLSDRILDGLYAAGITVISSSGNTGTSITWPASHPKVISIGSANLELNNRASYSSFEPQVWAVAAGTAIRTSKKGGGTTYLSGTSFASPQVAAILSNFLFKLRLSRKDNDLFLSHKIIKKFLHRSAIDINIPGYDPETGFGLLVNDPYMETLKLQQAQYFTIQIMWPEF